MNTLDTIVKFRKEHTSSIHDIATEAYQLVHTFGDIDSKLHCSWDTYAYNDKAVFVIRFFTDPFLAKVAGDAYSHQVTLEYPSKEYKDKGAYLDDIKATLNSVATECAIR